MSVGTANGHNYDATEMGLDGAARSLVFFAKQCGVRVDPKAVADGIAKHGRPDISAVVQFAKTLGLQFSISQVNRDELLVLGEPVLAELTDGGVVVVTGSIGDNLVVCGLRTTGTVTLSSAKFAEVWTGTVARFVSPRPKVFGRIGLRTALGFVREFRFSFASIALVSLLIGALELSLPISFMMIVDSITAHRKSNIIDIVIIGFVLLTTCGGLLSHFSHVQSKKVGDRIRMDLVSRFTRHVLSLPIGEFKDIKGAEVLSRIADLSIVHRVILNCVAAVWVDLLFIAVCVSIGSYFSSMLGLIMFVRLVLYLAVAHTSISKLRENVRRTQRSRRESSNLILDVLAGIETVKSHNAEQFAGKQINHKLNEVTELGGDYADFRSAISRYSVVVDRLAVGAILWVGAHQVIAGTLTLGQILAVYLMNRLMTRPINRLAGTIYDAQTVVVGLDEVNQLLEKETEVNANRQVRPARLDGRIRFADVHFRYAAGKPDSLQGVSFDIQPGEVVGIVGPSGSGKSTIVKLIQGLHLPRAGSVEIDRTGTDVLHPHWLREKIGVVPQDCCLFNRTVAENIRLGFPAVSREEIVGAARLACAHEFIVQLPKGYDTVATALSGGQRQRIAIARAIVHRPRILLLDESTAALDQETEATLVKNLESIFRDCTVIIAAHRITTLRHVHRIIALDEGRVVELGAPAELLRSGGYFAKMVRDQLDMLDSIGSVADAAKRDGNPRGGNPGLSNMVV